MSKAKAYRDELRRQADPYACFLQNKEQEERGRSVSADGPLPCNFISNYPQLRDGLQASEYRIPELSKTYVILKGGKVSLYPDADRKLLAGIPADADRESTPDVLYCDHDYRDRNGVRHTPFLKPDFSPHMLTELHYPGDYAAIDRDLLEEILGDPEADLSTIAQACPDRLIYALLLEASGRTNKIAHVTDVLFSLPEEKRDGELYAELMREEYPAPVRALQQRILEKAGIASGRRHSLSVIIPSKDHADILIGCLKSIGNQTAFCAENDVEILIVDNGSTEEQQERIRNYIGTVNFAAVRYLYQAEPFNFSIMCHRGAQEAKGDLLLFLNDDVELSGENVLERMCMFAASSAAGAVGIKLLFPEDDLIQHVGITNLVCGPTHKLSHHPDREVYYFGANRITRNVLALTGACLMLGREKYFRVGGFYDKMTVSYNDVDLCVSLYENGYLNILLNDCFGLHHESLSRGSDLSDADGLRRLAAEREMLYDRHPWLLTKPDPFYHPDLIQDTLDFRVNITADHEIRGKESKVEILECVSGRESAKLQFHIERTENEPDLICQTDGYFKISGWSLFLKHDERNYDRYLVLMPEEGQGKALRVSLMPVYRPDVAGVFSKQKYADLAGFAARIPAGALTGCKRYQTALLYVHKRFHHKTLVFGAWYEPGKGYESADGTVL